MAQSSTQSSHSQTQTPRALAEELYDAAIGRMTEGDSRAAIEGFRASLAADPAFRDAAHGLIHALKNAGELDEAIAVTKQLIASDPEDVLAYTSLSILYQHQGKIQEAEAAATRAKLLGWKQQLREPNTTEGGG
jgi:tetratricopeptide (TPR) repeat protein